jgi:hypothetical protein
MVRLLVKTSTPLCGTLATRATSMSLEHHRFSKIEAAADVIE